LSYFQKQSYPLAGIIDTNYRGKLKVLLHIFVDQPQLIDDKKRITQLILERAYISKVDVVSDLDDTERGSNGFGSTELQESQELQELQAQSTDNIPNTTDIKSTAPSDTPTTNIDNNTTTFDIDKDITITTKLTQIQKTSPFHLNNNQHQYCIHKQDDHTAAAAKLYTAMHVTFDM
jgi:hypothetical protein